MWTFARKNESRHLISFKWLGFCVVSIFFARFCFMLNKGRSDLRFCARKNSTNMLWNTSNLLVQTKCGDFFFVSAWKKPEYYWKTWRPVIGRYEFDSSRHADAVKKKRSHVTLFHWSWRSVWHQLFTPWLDIASGIRGGENFGLLTWTTLCTHPSKVCTWSSQKP